MPGGIVLQFTELKLLVLVCSAHPNLDYNFHVRRLAAKAQAKSGNNTGTSGSRKHPKSAQVILIALGLKSFAAMNLLSF
jgi:hypothetical protein